MVRRERQRGYDGEARAARERHSKAVNQNVCRGVAHLGVQTSKQDERGRLVTPPRVIMGLCKTTGGGGSPHSRHNKGPGHQQEIPSCSMGNIHNSIKVAICGIGSHQAARGRRTTHRGARRWRHSCARAQPLHASSRRAQPRLQPPPRKRRRTRRLPEVRSPTAAKKRSQA